MYILTAFKLQKQNSVHVKPVIWLAVKEQELQCKSLAEVRLDHGVLPTGVVKTQSDHLKECGSDLVDWNKVPERHHFQAMYYLSVQQV